MFHLEEDKFPALGDEAEASDYTKEQSGYLTKFLEEIKYLFTKLLEKSADHLLYNFN